MYFITLLKQMHFVTLGLINMKPLQCWFISQWVHPDWLAEPPQSLNRWLDGFDYTPCGNKDWCLPIWLGSGLRGSNSQGALGRTWEPSHKYFSSWESLIGPETLCLVGGRHVLIRSDNTAMIAYINRQSGVSSYVMHQDCLCHHLAPPKPAFPLLYYILWTPRCHSEFDNHHRWYSYSEPDEQCWHFSWFCIKLSFELVW